MQSSTPGPVWWGADAEPLEFRVEEPDRLAFQLWAHEHSGATARLEKTYRHVLAWSTAVVFFVLVLVAGTATLRPVLKRWVLLASALIAAATWLMGWAMGPSVARDKLRRHLRRAIRRSRAAATHPPMVRMWVDSSGVTLQEPGVRIHRDWPVLAEPATTPHHHFLIVRTYPFEGAQTAWIVPRRAGPAADALTDTVRRLAAAPSQGSQVPAVPPVWGPPPPGGVDFVLGVAEHERRLTWALSRGLFDVDIRTRRRREVSPTLALLPVLVILWAPAFRGYDWTALIPGIVITLPTIIWAGWAWATAPARELRQLVSGTAALCREAPVGMHGPTRVWLDETGLNVKYLHQHQHVDWYRITDVIEGPDLLLVQAGMLSLAVPRRAYPERVASLAAALRAATLRTTAPAAP